MTKIIVSILAFLLMIFPNSKLLIGAHQARTNTVSIVAPKIVDAIKARDAATLESFMCQNIKQNTSNLRGEINNMLDAIDGTITEATWAWRGGSYSESRSGGKKISQEGFEITVTTSVNSYALGIWWETINNFKPKEVGIRSIGLRYYQGAVLMRISATNGISDWHD